MVWVENLLKDLHMMHVKRNVLYIRRKRFSHKELGKKQVDIQYYEYFSPRTKVVAELKYTSNGKVGKDFGSCKNLVKSVYTRMKFTGADHAEIYTNKDFTESVKREAKKYHIRLYNGKKLKWMDRQRASLLGLGLLARKRPSLEHMISQIEITNQDLKPKVKTIYKWK